MLKSIAKAVFGDANERELNRHREVVELMSALEPSVQQMSDDALRAKTDEFKARLAEGETLDDLMVEAFAVVREAAIRTIGQRHYDVQLIGGIVLHQGKIAEMKTGEGKTLVATLPMYLNALTGRGVHLVTPNDYLSKFGLQQMGPIYHFLGLSSAVIQSRGGNESMHSFLFNPAWASDDARFQFLEPIERGAAYQADITYGTNNEFGFDYLRDNMVTELEQMVQRGHHYAIVDEVDNILIDEARTPLIISGQADQPSEWYTLFARLVQGLRPSSEDSIELEQPDGDYVEEVRHRSVYLTERGVAEIERRLTHEGRLQGDNLYDEANSPMLPYLDNALRASVVYKLDKDYVKANEQIIIVDEFTGRLMHGRRFSEGLHQAIEAKENVEVRRENLTLATITYQNYFRMYEKLAGMTGTAATEASEFDEIYNLEVTIIPTNLPIIRDDSQDLVYMSEKSKFNAVAEDIKDCQQRGQPVLVGTAAIETSERLSKQLQRNGVRHEVLNAKQHEREAVIIAQAGRPGAVTIATNMAGRGVDILLGGNPDGLAREKLRKRYNIDVTEASDEQWQEVLAEAKEECSQHREKVLDEGGLYVLGTERHEARRIDNQLRGRSGRQGDPGASRFYLSLEDELMRRFGGERVRNFMKWADMPEDMPIEHGMISKSIQQAQVRVEGHNFDIRKRVLEYDDVVNKQRETIYAQRRKILSSEADEIREQIQIMLAERIQDLAAEHLPAETVQDVAGWDPDEVRRSLITAFPILGRVSQAQIAAVEGQDDLEQLLLQAALEAYQERVDRFGQEQMSRIEKRIMLGVVDQLWQRNLTDLDVLREGIGLVGYGGRDPLVEYQRQSYEMWTGLQQEIKTKITVDLFRLTEPSDQRPGIPPAVARRLSNIRARQAGLPVGAMVSSKEEPQPVRKAGMYDNVGRNDLCPCGSGKKFKHCHYLTMQAERQTVPQSAVKQTVKRRRKR